MVAAYSSLSTAICATGATKKDPTAKSSTRLNRGSATLLTRVFRALSQRLNVLLSGLVPPVWAWLLAATTVLL